jgi:hypothetical protein
MADRRYYAKIDVGYLDNPKIASLIDEHPRAILGHLWCILYSRQHGTDGVVPMHLAMRHALLDAMHVSELVHLGLLEQRDARTLVIHDYLEHQESAEKVKQRSDLRRHAANVRWSKDDPDAGSNARSNAGSNAEERRGEERKTTRAARRSAAPEPDRFEEFWASYPRRSDKGHARTAYTKALRKTDVETLILGAKKYAAHVEGKDPKFVALPTTWLNGERWTDELDAGATPAAAASPWDRPTITDRRLAGEL